MAFYVERIDHDPCSLASEWARVLNAGAKHNVFLTWEWVSTWWKSFPAVACRPAILAVREVETGGVVALAPFFVTRHPHSALGPYRELSFVGTRAGAPDHLDVLTVPGYEAGTKDALACFLQSSGNGWDVVRANGVAAGGVLASALETTDAPTIIRRSTCPFIPLPDTWGEYESTLDGKFRYNLRSRARRLDKVSAGGVTFSIAQTPTEIAAAVEALVAFHAQRRDSSTLLRGEMAAFLNATARVFATTGSLRLYVMKVHEDPVAAAYCLSYGGSVFFYQTGFDAAWSRYGPGSAIIAHAIRESIAEGAEEFDFLRGNEAYKSHWTSHTRLDVAISIARTRLGRGLLTAHREGKPVLDRARMWKRSVRRTRRA